MNPFQAMVKPSIKVQYRYHPLNSPGSASKMLEDCVETLPKRPQYNMTPT